MKRDGPVGMARNFRTGEDSVGNDYVPYRPLQSSRCHRDHHYRCILYSTESVS